MRLRAVITASKTAASKENNDSSDRSCNSHPRWLYSVRSIALERNHERWRGQPRSPASDAQAWELDSDHSKPPPIALHDAIKFGKCELIKTYPELKQEKWNYSVSLQTEHHGMRDGTYVFEAAGREWTLREELHVTVRAWVYCVRFTRHPPVVGEGPVAAGPNFPVEVLFDGSVVLPTKSPARLDQARLDRQYDPVLTSNDNR